jgi:hypothetical protein
VIITRDYPFIFKTRFLSIANIRAKLFNTNIFAFCDPDPPGLDTAVSRPNRCRYTYICM